MSWEILVTCQKNKSIFEQHVQHLKTLRRFPSMVGAFMFIVDTGVLVCHGQCSTSMVCSTQLKDSEPWESAQQNRPLNV